MNADFVLGMIGLCGGILFIHATVCYFPIMSKTMAGENVPENTIIKTVHTVYQAMIAPFLALWLLLVVGLSGIV